MASEVFRNGRGLSNRIAQATVRALDVVLVPTGAYRFLMSEEKREGDASFRGRRVGKIAAYVSVTPIEICKAYWVFENVAKPLYETASKVIGGE